jgi:hypothetical protein
LSAANLRLAFEFGFERAEELHLKTAGTVAVAEREAPALFEWVTDGGDGTLLCDL